jgi:oligopeptidase B
MQQQSNTGMGSSDTSAGRAPMTAPVARAVPTTLRIHGHELPDEYAWLREKENPAVADYIEAENRYAEGYLAHTRPLQEKLYQEMVGRIKETDLSVPYRKGEYFYYARTEAGKQYRIYCRKHLTLDAAEEIVLDLNALADDGGYISLGHYEVSDDASLLAYTLDRSGFREYTLHVKDIASGELLPDTVEKVVTLEWGADGGTIYYTVEDEAKRSYRLYRHTLGTTDEVLLYEEADGMFRLHLDRALDDSYIYLYSVSHTTSECRFHNASEPDGDWTLVTPRTQDRQYFVQHHEGRFYIRVNDTGVNYRLVWTPDDAFSPENWREIIPHREDVMLAALQVFAKHYIVGERSDGVMHLRVTDIASGESHHIEFPEPVYEVYGIDNVEWNSTCFRYNYESLVTPASIFDYDIVERRSTLLKQTEVLGGYDPALYRSERIHATASDGVRIPISLVYHRDLRRDGSAPLHLQGYGSYGFPHPTGFSSSRLSLLDRGFVMAIAHVRGGGELGKQWHDAGRMKNKMNSFTDFIAVAEHLVAERYTSPDRMIAEGGSAGGLLMGAIVQRRPDLFAAVLLQVPFVDVINTMLDSSLPLTIGEYEEWGNPAVEEDFDYIRQYCPYTNLSRQAYPTMLVKTSFNDSQVMYWEPAKYVARLRTLKTDSNPLLLVTNMGAGHGGASGRYDRLRERALDFAFMLDRVGITD